MAQFDSHPNTPPLPLTEPLAAFVDIEEVGVRGGSHGMPSTHSTGKRSGGNSSSAKNSGHNNSSSTNTVISNNGGGDTEVDPYEGSVTRCICDFQHDDGYMICCDRCGFVLLFRIFNIRGHIKYSIDHIAFCSQPNLYYLGKEICINCTIKSILRLWWCVNKL